MSVGGLVTKNNKKTNQSKGSHLFLFPSVLGTLDETEMMDMNDSQLKWLFELKIYLDNKWKLRKETLCQ